MKRTSVSDVASLDGSTIQVAGFVESIRDLRSSQFIILRDRTGLLQLYMPKSEKNVDLNALVSTLARESAISVTGKVQINANVKLGGVELLVESLIVESMAPHELPVDETAAENLRMDWRFLDLRRRRNTLLFEIQTAAEFAMREYWMRHNFIELHSPKLMGTASESGAELFELPYFGSKAFLAQSPQFYKQMGIAAGFDKVFEIGPVFRANSSHTRRHDTEFTSVDVEVAWVASHEDVMKLEEEWLAYVFESVAAKFNKEVQSTFGVEITMPTLPFPRMTLSEARDILRSKGHVISHKDDLDPEGERLIAEHVRATLNHDFVFITEYPSSVRAFYHMRPDGNPDVTKSFDLIYKGVEITTGAQREHRIDRLVAQAIEKGYALDPLEDYFNFFRYGCPPHGGFGFGLSRLLMMMLNLESVREATYLYRGPNRLRP